MMGWKRPHSPVGLVEEDALDGVAANISLSSFFHGVSEGEASNFSSCTEKNMNYGLKLVQG